MSSARVSIASGVPLIRRILLSMRRSMTLLRQIGIWKFKSSFRMPETTQRKRNLLQQSKTRQRRKLRLLKCYWMRHKTRSYKSSEHSFSWSDSLRRQKRNLQLVMMIITRVNGSFTFPTLSNAPTFRINLRFWKPPRMIRRAMLTPSKLNVRRSCETSLQTQAERRRSLRIRLRSSPKSSEIFEAKS
jgi:hypothetical protein